MEYTGVVSSHSTTWKTDCKVHAIRSTSELNYSPKWQKIKYVFTENGAMQISRTQSLTQMLMAVNIVLTVVLTAAKLTSTFFFVSFFIIYYSIEKLKTTHAFYATIFHVWVSHANKLKSWWGKKWKKVFPSTKARTFFFFFWRSQMLLNVSITSLWLMLSALLHV